MDVWEATQNWLLFGVVAGGLVWYYYPNVTASSRPAIRPKEAERSAPAPQKKRTDRDVRPRQKPARELVPVPAEPKTAPAQSNGSNEANQRKAKGKGKKQPAAAQPAPQVVVDDEEPEEIDMSTRQFAQQLTQARKGHSLSGPKENEKKVRTVKQTSALDNPATSSSSSHNGTEANDDALSATSPSLVTGDVSDMLEPTRSGPTSLRLTGTTDSKHKGPKQAKTEVVETKKQRQNRQKVEERKLQREEEERQRKALEEKQRRAAREARGEPARNGLASAKQPSQNMWTTKQGHATNGYADQSSPLLDTFDADSASGPTGDRGAGSAAGSVTADVSEGDQASIALQQSVDESGWTTVAIPKKQKKGKSVGDEAESAIEPASEAQAVAKAPAAKTGKPLVNGKPNGFQALNVHYEQRTNVDPDVADNWDA